MDVIRLEAENCNNFQGFQICHGIGGGTGGSIAALLFPKLKDYYPRTMTQSFTVCPSANLSENVIEPYNSILSIDHLINECDGAFIIDNAALYNIVYNVLRKRKPTYQHINHCIAQVMSNITSLYRLPYDDGLNSSMRRLQYNLVPFPRLHFYLVSLAPIFNIGQGHRYRQTVQELTDMAWSSRWFFANVKSDHGKYLSVSCPYRGPMIRLEVDDEAKKVTLGVSEDFIKWIPNHIKPSLSLISPSGTMQSASIIANNTCIKGVFERILGEFTTIWKRRAYFERYTADGMEEDEFNTAERNVMDLIKEYQSIQSM